MDKFHVSVKENTERGRELKERMGENSALQCQYNGDEYWVSFTEHPQVKKRTASGEETSLISLPVNTAASILFGVCLFLCLGSMLFFTIKEGLRKKREKQKEEKRNI